MKNLLLFIFLISIVSISYGQVFKHPGLLHSKAELDLVKDKIKSNDLLISNAFTTLKTSSYANLNYSITPFVEVMCGSYNKPNVGCNQMVENGMAAYSLTLMWYFTDDLRYATKAIQILNAWSKTYVRNTDSNARLVVSWAAPWYINAAELLRSGNSEWTSMDQELFKNFILKFYPYVTDESMPANNWVLSSIEAHMTMAVYLDDQSMFDHAVSRWKSRVPTYIYLKTDGPNPLFYSNRTLTQTLSTWKSTSSGTAFIDGLSMETCRDLGHAKLGINSMLYAAEVAYHQGVDLFSLEKERLSHFFELHASWMLGKTAVPSNICGGVVKVSEPDAQGIKPPTGGGGTAFEIGYNHLSRRMKMQLPLTGEMVAKNRPVKASRWVLKWETLTHAPLEYLTSIKTMDNTLPFYIYPTISKTGTFKISEWTGFEVYNLFGIKVQSGVNDFIDLIKEPPGVYIVKIQNQTLKIIKE